MKKACLIVVCLVLLCLSTGCGAAEDTTTDSSVPPTNDPAINEAQPADTKSDITIEGIESAIQIYDADFSFDDKPLFDLIGASDGWMGYTSTGHNVVKVYQYDSDASYNDALELYASTIGEWPKNGNFVLETTDPGVTSAFTSYDGNLDNVEVPEPVETSVLAIGDESSLKDWSISVTGFEFTSRIDNGYSYFDSDEGNQFGVVSLSVTNNGTEAANFLPSFGYGDDVIGKIIYNEEYEYSSTQLLGYESDMHDKFLNPLSSASGVIVFEVPEAVVNGSESLIFTLISGSDQISFSLR